MRTERIDLRLANEAWESLMTAHARLTALFAAEDMWDEAGMREYDVLFTLSGAEDGRLRLRELAESSLLSQPSLSRMVERLEAAGWVRRLRAPEDGRGVLVTLTTEGAALQKEVGRRHVEAIAHYVGGALEDDQLRDLIRVTGALRAAQPEIGDLPRP